MPLNEVSRLLIASDHELLILLHLAYFSLETEYLLIKFLQLLFHLHVPFALVSEVVFHILVDTVYIFLLLKVIVGLRGTLHELIQLGLKVGFLSVYAIKFLMHEIQTPHYACIVIL